MRGSSQGAALLPLAPHPSYRAFFQRYGEMQTFLMGAWAHEFQHRYRQALFGNTPVEETPFSLAQVGGEQVQIVVNVLLMSSQTGNSVCHSRPPEIKISF